MERRSSLVPVISLTVVVSFSLSAPGREIEKGRLLDGIACRADAGQSYALYLPSGDDRVELQPVLFLFDPAARGAEGVRAFLSAAEKFGWILIGSNNSKNGPLKDSVAAGRALWAEAKERFPVDENRVYAAGFSGGSRVASIFAQVIGRKIAGVIGCGAGLAEGLGPDGMKAEAYFGLAGLRDFNYEEMKTLDRTLDPFGIPHRILVFDGVHDWPDPVQCERAAGWMEVLAVKSGRAEKDETMIRSVIDREMDEARSLEKDGRVHWAAERFEAAAGLAEGMIELPGAAGRAEALRKTPAAARFWREEKTRERRTELYRTGVDRALGRIEADETGGAAALAAVLKDLGVRRLKKEAAGAETIENRALASRLLFLLSFSAQVKAASTYERAGLSRTAAFLDLAIAACEEGLSRLKSLYFSRARIAARAGDRKAALDFLGEAVERGFDDIEILDGAEELEGIRNEPRYREIREKLGRLPAA